MARAWRRRQALPGAVLAARWRAGCCRLWVYLESQSFNCAGIGEGAVRLWLAPPMFSALGMADKQAPQARRTLLRAGERISAADRSFVGFELHKPPRRGGTWALVARRRLPASLQSAAS